MKDLNQNPSTKLLFSDKALGVIDHLLEKYKLDKDIKEDVKEKLEKAEDPLVREGIQFLHSKKIQEQLKSGKNLDEVIPFRKLRNIVKELSENKTSIKDLPLVLQQRLDISSKISKELAKDIESDLSFLLSKKSSEILEEEVSEEKKPSVLPRKDISSKKNIEEKMYREDSYRETIK